MLPSATATEEHAALGELVPLLELVPSPLNPRKSFNQETLKELSASILSKGIIEPLIVRRRAGLAQLEIVAGERRYLAARAIKLDLLPVIIRTLSDLEVLELMAIENSQRDDLHPLEEADGYLALMKADPAYTPKAIAAKIGKSDRYVHQRLQLARLEPEVKKAFLANHLTAGHADLISRLKAEDQTAALQACFHNLYGDDKERGVISVRSLDRWIDQNVRLHLDPTDPQTAYFPELAKAVETAAETGAKILQVVGSYLPKEVHEKQFADALPQDAWRAVEGKKNRCKYAQRAVVILGNGRGQQLEVCTARTECKTHWHWEVTEAERKAKTASTTKTKEPRAAGDKAALAEVKRAAERAQKARALETLHRNVLEAALRQFKKAPVTRRAGGVVVPVPAVLQLLALSADVSATWPAVLMEHADDVINQAGFRGPAYYAKAAKIFSGFGIKFDAIEKELQSKTAQTSAKKKGRTA